jgi:hypothetical protein
MSKQTGDASRPVDGLSLLEARRELIGAAFPLEWETAQTELAAAISGKASGDNRDEARINALNYQLVAIEDEAIRIIHDAMTGGKVMGFFEGYHSGERAIPLGWLDTDWLRERLLIDGVVPIDEGNNRDKNGSERLVYFRLSEWRALLPSLIGIPAGHKSSSIKIKRGPKFKYDWIEGRQYFDPLMASNGDLDDRQEWSARADIEREVSRHMEKHGGGEPAPSLVQQHVSAWLADFRASQTAHN